MSQITYTGKYNTVRAAIRRIFRDDERPYTWNKETAETLERINCKHT